MKADECRCSGCRACENICPKKCIKIDDDKRRFTRLRGEVCIGCGLCDLVCPQKETNILTEPILGINAWNQNRRILRDASSGGVASTLYRWGLENGINCVGVNFDDEYCLKYRFISSQNELDKAVGSKYVYSDMNNIYEQIVTILKKGEKIIFVGLPCHVSALKKYCTITKMSTDNLYCVDIVCHGVMMPYFWKKHVMYLKKRYSIKNESKILFRSKQNQFGITFISSLNKCINISVNDDAYMSMYIRGIYTEACYECPYAQKRRIGDLTIKDCCTEFNNRKKKTRYNQSSVLVNTSNGKKLWDRINTELEYYVYPVDKMVNEDYMLRSPTIKPKEYKLLLLLDRLVGYRSATNIIWGVNRLCKKWTRME